ncbi:MAG: hypothetical protein M1828_005292 [Chrysothrix sp. TS-e1954]|nr:MAG: hypothetical protein M1828_005292 [Chrysothrix sp. TS-e1954]
MSASLSQRSGYRSESDSGDELFTNANPFDHQTIPTQPLTSPPSKTQATQQSYITQPTQPLDTPLHHGAQVGNWRSPSVQVARSSPVNSPTPSKSQGPIPPPLPRGSLNGGALAYAMAPPGTAFRPPAPPSQPSQMSTQARSQTLELSDDEARRVSDSSDDEASRRANDIKPTKFVMGNRPLGGVRSTDSSRSNFSNLTANYRYDSSPMKRAVEETTTSNANPARPSKVPRQYLPAKSVASQPSDISIDQIQDYNTRRKIENIRMVLPKSSVRKCLAALNNHRANESDAMDWLVREEEKEQKRQESTIDLTQQDQGHRATAPSAKRNFNTGVSINQKWSSTQQPQRPSQLIGQAQDQRRAALTNNALPSVKQGTDLPRRSINEKWSGIQNNQVSSPPAPVRRRLVPGKNRERSPIALSSSPVQPITQPKRLLNKPKPMESDEDDSPSEAEIEDDISPEVEFELVNLINNSSVADIIDISGSSTEVVDTVVAGRPFASLNAIKIVGIAKTSKAGKTRNVNVGEKFVDACLETMTGYKAVDQLVEQCDRLGQEVKSAMSSWGLDAYGKSGELEMTSLESNHDSGIGTPSSTGNPTEEDGSKPRKTRVLQQPSMMSSNLIMKDYQVAGLNWLALLHSKGLSGALCDEMGLGKTCQVIAFLAHLKESGVKGTHLIIVPGSTIQNWLREFKNFCPSLNVEPYYGSKKERPGQQAQLIAMMASPDTPLDVIVTTYDMAWKAEDSKFLRRKVSPHVCVYDEGHALRNSSTQRYESLMQISAKMRLLLTGTPLQNNLQELVSLLAFMMPRLFDNIRDDLKVIFKHRAKTSDQEHTALLSAERISRAKAMVTPFILRRKKRQVLKQLPKKSHSEQYCDMTDSQRSIYDEILTRVKKTLQDRDSMNAQKNAKTKEKASRESTNVMMELRKAAIHPLLFRRQYSQDTLRKIAKVFCRRNAGKEIGIVLEDLEVMTDYELHRFCTNFETHGHVYEQFALEPTAWMDSGKVKALVSLLQKHKAEGHRTLVFSQFTMVMDILDLVFETADIPYYRIDGSTEMSARQDMIDEFYKDETPVFMLTTGAGGTGVNLACADRVVLFDLSFNPQVDLQAEDRAHRVGQVREVEVTRLITKDSVEEQILALAKSKLMLDERVAGEDSQGVEEAGQRKVEEMIMKSLQQKNESDGGNVLKTEDEENATSPGARKSKRKGGKDITHRTKVPADISSDYMDGLKSYGLNMSAASK